MKRGSALLVVLGLLSFLVVSAMAFSVYMRSSRLPSSYLLRVSSSRNLVKSALAEALDEIDRAIGNYPHPGVPENSGCNHWYNRVLTGTNMLVSTDQTVSTLTLEGLAYVPAPLINEVRYYSRRSPAAVWHQLGFNAGRYAFTAVDVSDYFDVNRTMAAPEGGGRTSADNARVTLAYLFENQNHSDWRLKPTDWDAFMDAYYDDGTGNKVPLVSIADFHLALWDKKPDGMISPWCRFISDGTEFVQDDPVERHTLSNMVFVTDSLYAQSTSGMATYSLANSAYQPFTAAMKLNDPEGYTQRGFLNVLENVNATAKIFDGGTKGWGDMLAPPEAAQLMDYLDVDGVPCSLALPTVERTPMVTGVQLLGQLETKVEQGNSYTTPDQVAGNETFHYKVSTYTVNVLSDLKANIGAVYPFKHKHGATHSFKAQAFAAVTFVADGTDNLRFGSDNWATMPDWTTGSDQQASAAQAFSNADGCPSGFTIRSAPQTVPLKTITDSESAVLADIPLEFGAITPLAIAKTLPTTANGINGLQADTCTLRVCQKEIKQENNGVVTWIPAPGVSPTVEFGGLPAAADLSGAKPSAEVVAAVNAIYRPVVQVWVRIYDETSNSANVDLVPACWKDDRNPTIFLAEASSAKTRAALRFVPTVGGADTGAIKFTGTTLEGGAEMRDVSPVYLADDPRFNHAPENLVALSSTSGSTISDIWKAMVLPRAEARDGDIFMATSDAGYLQSKYELAYLLRIANFNVNVDFGCLSGSGYDGKARASFGASPADAAMWHTYTPYKTIAHDRDVAFTTSLASLGSGSRGMRVCPYTPDTAVMMGALANTPYDWWAASTNDQDAVKAGMLSDVVKALEYTFSDYSSDPSTKVSWGDLEKMANIFIRLFRNSTTVDGWEALYDEFDWDGDLPIGSLTLDSVDRKYLYGFWRDCFAARQQLFLVFLRAEPMMMGGGAIGQMPPMLGARAVALVWRNPAPTDNNAPHPMRVLFYRQFD